MSMTDWAKREVEIACKREKENNEEDGMWDYGCACYESALKAFNSLMEDGHSGMSIGFTKNILNRLIDGKPLTPIEDTDDVWGDITTRHRDGSISYQCTRMTSLFKDVDKDGNVTYSDVNRFVKIDVDNPSSAWHSSLIDRIMGEMFPIKMPYSGETYKVYCKDLLTDPKNGDFDTIGIYYAILPNGEKLEISRYFKELGPDWAEIDVSEYNERQMMDAKFKED